MLHTYMLDVAFQLYLLFLSVVAFNFLLSRLYSHDFNYFHFFLPGGWQTLRSMLIERNWVEKFETVPKIQKPPTPLSSNLDDLCINLPAKQSWETQTAHIKKCERTIMSRMLQMYDADFYWNMRKDQNNWQHRTNTNKIMNRFSRSLFTSKEGLCLLLHQMHWHVEPGVAFVNFPRCYVLGAYTFWYIFTIFFRKTVTSFKI